MSKAQVVETAGEDPKDPTYVTLADLDKVNDGDSAGTEDEPGEDNTGDDEKDKKKDPPKGDNKSDDGEDPSDPKETVEDDPADPDNGDDPAAEDDSIFNDVDELHGEALEVDYGDVDPLSPEGIYIREQAIESRAIDRFESTLKERSPRAYAYLLHSLNGGSDDEFFQKAEGIGELPSEDTLEVDVDVQREMIERNLKRKGNNERQIKAILKAAEADDELEEMAKEALQEEKVYEKKRLEDLEAKNAEELEARDASIAEMNTYVDQMVTSGKIGNIVIPEKDRKEFAKVFKDTLRLENDQFVSVTPLSQENIEETFQKEYFRFKKGNLEGLIERAARTQNTKRLVKTINTNPKVKSTDSDASRKQLTLGDV